jgi:hypothetical protein
MEVNLRAPDERLLTKLPRKTTGSRTPTGLGEDASRQIAERELHQERKCESAAAPEAARRVLGARQGSHRNISASWMASPRMPVQIISGLREQLRVKLAEVGFRTSLPYDRRPNASFVRKGCRCPGPQRRGWSQRARPSTNSRECSVGAVQALHYDGKSRGLRFFGGAERCRPRTSCC